MHVEDYVNSCRHCVKLQRYRLNVQCVPLRLMSKSRDTDPRSPRDVCGHCPSRKTQIKSTMRYFLVCASPEIQIQGHPKMFAVIVRVERHRSKVPWTIFLACPSPEIQIQGHPKMFAVIVRVESTPICSPALWYTTDRPLICFRTLRIDRPHICFRADRPPICFRTLRIDHLSACVHYG